MEERRKINQEWDNLSKSEKKGLKSLRKRIRKGEIVVLKSDKSSKLCVIKKEKYLQVGIKNQGEDKKIDRIELQKIEKKINEHTRMLCKIMNIGENNNHLQKIIESK